MSAAYRFNIGQLRLAAAGPVIGCGWPYHLIRLARSTESATAGNCFDVSGEPAFGKNGNTLRNSSKPVLLQAGEGESGREQRNIVSPPL